MDFSNVTRTPLEQSSTVFAFNFVRFNTSLYYAWRTLGQIREYTVQEITMLSILQLLPESFFVNLF